MSDVDADAWKAAIVAAGGAVDVTQDSAMQGLCVGLKADSVFAKLKNWWPIYTNAGVGARYIDFVARLAATPVNTPTWTAKAGVAFNGTSQYLNLNTNGSASLNSFAFGFDALVDTPPENTIQMGASGSLGQDFIAQVNLEWSDNNTYFAVDDANGDTGRASPADKRGLWTFNRTGAGGADAYQANSLYASNGQTSTVVPVTNFLLAACSDGAGTIANFATFTAGCAFLSSGLTATNIANMSARWVTYKAALDLDILMPQAVM